MSSHFGHFPYQYCYGLWARVGVRIPTPRLGLAAQECTHIYWCDTWRYMEILQYEWDRWLLHDVLLKFGYQDIGRTPVHVDGEGVMIVVPVSAMPGAYGHVSV